MVTMADLLSITYAVTHHCNLACAWCFEGASAQVPFEFDLDFRKRLIERIGSKERHLTLTGGEPFTYPDILPLLEMALKHFRSVGVTTNGVKFHREHIDFIQRHGISLTISVDGPESVHDTVRGRGTYQRIKKNVRMFLDLCVPVSLQIILSRSLIPRLEPFAEEVASWGVENIAFQRLQPVGRGVDTPTEHISVDEALHIARRLKTIVQNYQGRIKIKTKDPLHRTLNDSLKAKAAKHPRAVLGGCRAAISYLFVEVDGTALPCPFLRLPVGNVMQQTLEEIWLQAPLLIKLRTRACYKVCINCANWTICRGCRAHALMHCGDVMGRDPLCWNTVSVEKQISADVLTGIC